MIERLRAGDAAAEDELTRRYLDLVLWLVNLAGRCHRSGFDIEDVKGDCLLHFLRLARTTYDPSRGKFKAFVSKCILIQAHNMLSKKDVQLARMPTLSLEREIELGHDLSCTRSADALNLLESDEYRQALAISEISSPRYKAIVDAMMTGATHSDIARNLGVSKQAVNKLVKRIKQRVREVA